MGHDLSDEAWLEFHRDGRLGQRGAELMAGIVADVSGARRASGSYPSLDGDWEWRDPSALDEATNEFAAHLLIDGRLDAAVAGAANGADLARRLRGQCLWWFQERGRTTTAGKFHVKLRKALRWAVEQDQLRSLETPAGEAWRRPQDPSELYAGGERELIEVAFGVAVTVLTYDSEKRDSPGVDKHGLLDICMAALTLAEAALLTATLRRVAIARLGIDTRGIEEPSDDVPAATVDDLDIVEDLAATVLSSLDSESKRVLALEMTVAKPSDRPVIFGLGRSQAAAQYKRAREALEHGIANLRLEDRVLDRRVAARVLRICLDASERTQADGVPSDQFGGET